MARRAPKIDKGLLTFGEPRRVRSAAHLSFIHEHGCCVCGTAPVQAHHLTFAQPRARGLKVSDAFTVPVCLGHHNAAHAAGDERVFWAWAGIDPLGVAERLWRASPGRC